MSNAVIFLGFISFILLATTVLFVVLYLRNRKPESDIPANAKFLVNFAPHRSGGHALGSIIRNYTPEANPRSQIIKFIPRDRHLKIDGTYEGLDKASLTITNLKLIDMKLSSFKDILFALPKDATDYCPEFLGTTLGKAFAFHTESINVLQTSINAIKQGNQTSVEIIRELHSDELLGDFLAKFKNGMKAMADTTVQEAVKKKEDEIPR